MTNSALVDADTIQAQARVVIQAEGFAAFKPAGPAYAFAIGSFPVERLLVVPIGEIEPPLRTVGVAMFPRAKRYLDAIRSGGAQLPIEVELLPEMRGPYRYRVLDGFHRFHLSLALGFSEIPVIVWRHVE